jgi:hypothetical protein
MTGAEAREEYENESYELIDCAEAQLYVDLTQRTVEWESEHKSIEELCSDSCVAAEWGGWWNVNHEHLLEEASADEPTSRGGGTRDSARRREVFNHDNTTKAVRVASSAKLMCDPLEKSKRKRESVACAPQRKAARVPPDRTAAVSSVVLASASHTRFTRSKTGAHPKRVRAGAPDCVTRGAAEASATAVSDLHQMLLEHNSKFKSCHTYEPSMHGAREVRKVSICSTLQRCWSDACCQWEQRTGQKYYELNPADRATVNRELAREKIRARRTMGRD